MKFWECLCNFDERERERNLPWELDMNRLSSEVVRREALVVCACDSSLSFSFCLSFSLSFSNITLPLSPSSTLKVPPSPFNPWSFFELWLLPATPVSPLVPFDASLDASTLPSDCDWLVISAKLVITSSYSITPNLQIRQWTRRNVEIKKKKRIFWILSFYLVFRNPCIYSERIALVTSPPSNRRIAVWNRYAPGRPARDWFAKRLRTYSEIPSCASDASLPHLGTAW